MMRGCFDQRVFMNRCDDRMTHCQWVNVASRIDVRVELYLLSVH